MKPLTFLLLLLSFPLAEQQKDFMFVFLNKKSDATSLPKEQNDKIMEGHMANINRLAKEGKLIVAGPFENGGGIFILNTTSVEEAKEWLSTDPGIQANRWNIETILYTPRIGGACAVGEDYKMIMYSFVRFTAVVSKFNASSYTVILKNHDDYINQINLTGNVIAEGTFGAHDGGILIMKGEVEPSLFENDPGVQEGLLQFELKSLWVAKGSFCESKD